MKRIEQRLRHGMGLDAATIGSASLQRTIRLRMKATGAASVDDYEQLLATSATEWSQLVEAVVVTETWFYRDPQALVALATMILTDWLPAHATGRVRILSLPCSSGEEPYSIAMALVDAGIDPARFAIDAVDLSQRALDKAAAAVYGRNSFRGQNLNFRERHFDRAGELYAVKQAIRACVTFQQANLLSDHFVLPRGRYDFVFCRNLLIYFDRETQRRAFKRLETLLLAGGTLFLGPAEVPLAMQNGFSRHNLPMAFACQRRSDADTIDHPAPQNVAAKPSSLRNVAPAPSSQRPTAKLKSVKPKAARHPEPVVPTADARDTTLAVARDHADKGRLIEAVRLCQAHLDQHGPSVDAYYLLGVLQDALGHADAREFYRKALYLDPSHCESLLQMAFLAEREGDAAAARNLRRRAQKQQISPP